MPITLDYRRVRVTLNTASFGSLKDQLTSSPIKFPIADTRLELGLFQGPVSGDVASSSWDLINLANFVSITVQFKAVGANNTAPAGTAAALVSKTIVAADFGVLTKETWQDYTAAHIAIDITEADSVNLGSAGMKWLVVTGLTSGGRTVPLGFGTIEVVEDGYNSGVSAPPSGVPGFPTALSANAVFETNAAADAYVQRTKARATVADVTALLALAETDLPANGHVKVTTGSMVDNIRVRDGDTLTPIDRLGDLSDITNWYRLSSLGAESNVIEVEAYGGSPAADAADNTTAIETAIAAASAAGGGMVRLTRAGNWDFGATIKPVSNVHLFFSPGVNPRKAHDDSYIICNAGAYTNTRDSNITITAYGALLKQNGHQPANYLTDLDISGLRGNVSALGVDGLTLRGVKITDGQGMYNVHTCDCTSVHFEDCWMEGDKDGYHLDMTVGVLFVNCTACAGDDGWAFFGRGWRTGGPRSGGSTNITLINCVDLARDGQSGSSIRTEGGSWVNWSAAYDTEHGDLVDNAGYQYQRMNDGGTIATSEAPTHTTFGTIATTADGIDWRCNGQSTGLLSDVRGVKIINFRTTASRSLVNIGAAFLTDGASSERSNQPGASRNGISDQVWVESPIWEAANHPTGFYIVGTLGNGGIIGTSPTDAYLPSKFGYVAATGSVLGTLKLAHVRVETWHTDASGIDNGLVKVANGCSVEHALFEDCYVKGAALATPSHAGMLIHDVAGCVSRITVRRGSFDNVEALIRTTSKDKCRISLENFTIGTNCHEVFDHDGNGAINLYVRISDVDVLGTPTYGVFRATAGVGSTVHVWSQRCTLGGGNFIGTSGVFRCRNVDMPIGNPTYLVASTGDRIKDGYSRDREYNGSRWVYSDYIKQPNAAASATTALQNFWSSDTLWVSTQYKFRAVVHFTADATGGIKLAVTAPGTSPTVLASVRVINDADGSIAGGGRISATGGTVSVAGPTSGTAIVEGTVTTGSGTAGGIAVQYAESVATGTVNLSASSSVQMW